MEQQYKYFEKYKLKIEFYKDKNGKVYSTGFLGEPSYPNGFLLNIVWTHSPLTIRHFRQISLEEEISVISSIIKSGRPFERYPLIAEFGQICIYRDNTFVYDTLLGDGVIGNEGNFDGRFDESSEEPIMILPSSDMLGILKDFKLWKEEEEKPNR